MVANGKLQTKFERNYYMKVSLCDNDHDIVVRVLCAFTESYTASNNPSKQYIKCC